MKAMKYLFALIFLSEISHAVAQQPDTVVRKVAKEGYIINQDQDKGTKKNSTYEAYLSADSASTETNLEESLKLAILREEIVMQMREVHLNLNEMMKADKFDKQIAEKVSKGFDEIMVQFEKINDGRFDSEINLLESIWVEFENCVSATGEEQLDKLMNLYDIWLEANITITSGLNSKFDETLQE